MSLLFKDVVRLVVGGRLDGQQVEYGMEDVMLVEDSGQRVVGSLRLA